MMLAAILLVALAADPAPPGQIAFMRAGRVWLINADGTGERALTEELPLKADRPLVWMPDGQRILYWHHSKVGWDIWSVKADGTGHVNLTNVKSGGCRSPAPSPDGKQIAFMRDDPAGLHVMNADGSNQRRLAETTLRDATPTWSPDGRWLAYPREDRDGIAVHGYELATQRSSFLVRGVAPAWAPAGAMRLAITHAGPPQALGILAPGAASVRVMPNAGAAREPAWSPDGKLIACFTPNGDKVEVRVIDGVGENMQTLATVDGRWYVRPSWSPDGRWLTFCAGPDRHANIYIVDVPRRRLRTLADGGWFPAWRPVVKAGGSQ